MVEHLPEFCKMVAVVWSLESKHIIDYFGKSHHPAMWLFKITILYVFSLCHEYSVDSIWYIVLYAEHIFVVLMKKWNMYKKTLVTLLETIEKKIETAWAFVEKTFYHI